MSSLVRYESQFKLSPEKLQAVLAELKTKLVARVESAYVFGSAATGEVNEDSDIDLILLVKNPTRPFVQRGFDFLDLFDLWPRLDLLVYTPEELAAQLADSEIGFWKSVKLSMREL